MENILTELRLKADNCNNTKEGRARKGAYVDCIVMIQQVKNLSLSAVSNCACSVDETTGWTEVKCCNICGKPIKGQNWHCC